MKKKKKKRSIKPHQIVASDDEDDVSNNNTSRSRPKRGYVSKELKNLALVDLTTPLGEDDVMPRNEHYVVPERQTEPPKASTKKAKKKKSSTKNKSTKLQSTTAGGDHLAFDPPITGYAGMGLNHNNVTKLNNKNIKK